MIVGEAPGRLGADDTGVPFHGDKAGHNFEELLRGAGLSREDCFITNSVLCNPKDEFGNNSTPNRSEVSNCAAFLKRQIDIVQPEFIVTLGGTSLGALSNIEGHSIALRDGVRKVFSWYGRKLIPLYHPGQRAMIHRSMANQRSDYAFLAAEMRKKGINRAKTYGVPRESVVNFVKYVLSRRPETSYFSLHKILFILEAKIYRKFSVRYTDAFFLRQLDGPYCTDLHMTKLANAFSSLRVSKKGGQMRLSGLDGEEDLVALGKGEAIDLEAEKIVDSLLDLDAEELKHRAYIATPMRRILREEREAGVVHKNRPIEF